MVTGGPGHRACGTVPASVSRRDWQAAAARSGMVKPDSFLRAAIRVVAAQLGMRALILISGLLQCMPLPGAALAHSDRAPESFRVQVG